MSHRNLYGYNKAIFGLQRYKLFDMQQHLTIFFNPKSRYAASKQTFHYNGLQYQDRSLRQLHTPFYPVMHIDDFDTECICF